jgi:hypothetical protein
LDKQNCPSEICMWFQGVNISTKYFCFSQIGIYILKIHLSTWNLDYMIPKGISHSSVQNPTHEFQKRKYLFHSELPRTVILAGHFYGFGRFVPSTGILTWTALWGHYVSSFDNPVAKYLLPMQGSRVQIKGVKFIILSWWHPWGPRFKSGFHNSFWDYVFLTEYHEWIWKYINEIWKFENKFWLILFREYKIPKLFAE